jgi:uncharacterized protein (DUF1800 family)
MNNRISFVIATTILLICISVYAPQSVAQASVCPFNVDGSGTVADALRDGVVLSRYARGERNAQALVAGTSAVASTVLSTITANLDRLDIDGSGAFDAADAASILRLLFSYNTASAAAVPKGDFATRDTPAALKAYLDGGCASTPLADLQRASKFLVQASFGPSFADINAFNALAEDTAVQGSSTRRKASTWINAQFNTPRSQRHWDDIKQHYDAQCPTAGQCGVPSANLTRHSFWKQAITAPDQLRQRMAFALSQILVVSSFGAPLNGNELAVYQDLLNDNALGNYRSIIDGALRSGAMNLFLSNYRNDGSRISPNENLAREMLQLFSTGLVQLNIDGTPVSGNLPTFTENTVKGFARAFTGLSYDDRLRTRRCVNDTLETIPSWNWTPLSTCSGSDNTVVADREGYARPFIAIAGHHSAAPRALLQYDPAAAGTTIADPRCAAAKVLATQNVASVPTVANTYGTQVAADTAERLIDDAVTNIFCHPNVGPFIGKQLIRFFVTSTPSPAYVARVSSSFNNDGGGVRGDMKAVIRAILLDEEALEGAALPAAERPKYGKLREPILRLSHILRVFPRPTTGAPPFNGRYFIDQLITPEYGINQSPFESPSVFNFFHPQFAPQGPVKRVGATAPEFEITTTTSIAQTQNYFGKVVSQSTTTGPYSDFGYFSSFGYFNIRNAANCSINTNPPVYDDCLFMDYSELAAKVDSTSDMLDYVNLVLLGGKLPASVKATYLSAVDERFSPNYAGLTPEQLKVRKRERVRVVAWLAVHSPEFQVQY